MEHTPATETGEETREKVTRNEFQATELSLPPQVQQVAAIRETESPLNEDYYIIPEEGGRPGTPEWQVAIGNEWWEKALENCSEFGEIYRGGKGVSPK